LHSDSDTDRRKIDLGSIRRVLSSRNVVLTYIVFIAFAIPANFKAVLFPIYGTETLSLSASLVSVLFTIRGTSNALFRIPVGMLADRIGRKKPLFLSQALVALVFFLLSQIRSFFGLAIVFAIYGVAWGTNAVVGSSQVQDHVSSGDRGVAGALQGIMFDIGGIIGSIIAGAIATTIPVNKIFQISAIIPLLGLAGVQMMRRNPTK
jgi:MFS family permease